MSLDSLAAALQSLQNERPERGRIAEGWQAAKDPEENLLSQVFDLETRAERFAEHASN